MSAWYYHVHVIETLAVRTLVKIVVLPLSEGPMRTTLGSPFFPRLVVFGASIGLPTVSRNRRSDH